MRVSRIGLAAGWLCLSAAALVQATNLWMDDFTGGTPGEKPGSWFDVTDRGGGPNPAEMVYSQSDSYADITVTGMDGAGYVTSITKSVDLSTYNRMEVVISDIQAGTTKVEIALQKPTWEYFVFGTPTVPGTYSYNISSVTGESGTQLYYFVLKVYGPQWCYATFDSVRIYDVDYTPTATPTVSPTPTETMVCSPTDSPTKSPTSTQTPDWTMTDTPTITPTSTNSATYTPTSYTPTSTPTGVNNGWVEDFDPPSDWTLTNVQLDAQAGIGWVTFTGTGEHKMESAPITTDVTAFPYFIATVDSVEPEGSAQATIQLLNVYDGTDYHALSPNLTQPGVLVYDYASATGWSGIKTFRVVIWIGSADGDKLGFDCLEITSQPPTATPTPIVGVNELRPSANIFRPKQGSLTIHYGAEDASRVRITVYNLAGRKIRTLVDGPASGAVDDQVRWDGKNANGDWVASGVYIIRLESNRFQKNIRVAVVK